MSLLASVLTLVLLMDSSTVRWDLSFVDMASSGVDFTICSRWTLLSTYWLALILTDESARVYCYMVHLAYLINSPLLTWVLLHGLLGLKYLMLVLTLPAMHFVIAL